MRNEEWGIVDQEEQEKLAQLEKEREARMHGVAEPTHRDTGDMQDEDVRVCEWQEIKLS